MKSPPREFSILLIDDDAQEKRVIEKIASVLTEATVMVDHVARCSEGVGLLNSNRYDLVLLDNRLSDAISAEFTVPFIRSAFNRAPIAIISADVSAPYLQDQERLGVDYIVDKANMIKFMRQRLADAGLLGSRPTPSAA